MPVITDHLEAILAQVTTQDLERMRPADLRRLSDRAYQIHVWAEQVSSVAAREGVAGQPHPRVQPAEEPKAEPEGVLDALKGGRQG